LLTPILLNGSSTYRQKPRPKTYSISKFRTKHNNTTSNQPRCCDLRRSGYTDLTVTRKQFSAAKCSKNSRIRRSEVSLPISPYCHMVANQHWPFVGHLSQGIDLAASAGINLDKVTRLRKMSTTVQLCSFLCVPGKMQKLLHPIFLYILIFIVWLQFVNHLLNYYLLTYLLTYLQR